MDPFSPLAMRKMDRIAASRQKSCNACVRGKRKCDKRAPRCTRCAAKGLECIYQRMPPGASHQPDEQQQHHHIQGGNASVSVSVSDVPDFDMGFDMESLHTGSSSNTNTTDTSPESDSLANDVLQLDSGLDFSIMDLMTSTHPSADELWTLHDYSSKMSIPPVPEPPRPGRDLAMLSDLKMDRETCMAFNPLDVHDPRTRIGSVVAYMHTIPTEFAQTRTFPCLPPRLYGHALPRTVLAAFSAAVAYAGRTPQNKPWVLKLIADLADEVYREGARAESHVEKLARLQALVVLDAIRVFDGDVALRAASERQLPIMVEWTLELVRVRDELDEGIAPEILISRERPPKTWESWILLESVRRTTILAFSFMCITSMLKSLEPPLDMFTCSHSFTASRHLWEADSSLAFYRAWNEKPQYCVVDMGLKDLWLYGQAEDVDTFTKFMLTAQIGPEAVDHFMSS
ncbi:hypothetical protein G7046_g8723 [Stylonectria norvegica]|nr:hypothetical protein G7046_g8723 [Stylonectria norvegica]